MARRQAFKKVYVGKFVKISKVCEITAEYFQVLPLHKTIVATPLIWYEE